MHDESMTSAKIERHPTRWNRIAWLGLLAMVVARATVLEIIREPFDVNPGTKGPPLATGPGTIMAMNAALAAIAFVAAVCGRRKAGRCTLLLTAAGLWAVASTLWASDKYLALVTSTTLLASGLAAWAAGRLCDTAIRRRQLLCVACGIGLMWTGYGVYQRLVDHPQDVADYKQHRAEILRDHGWDENTFSLQQFERKLNSAEISGFVQSPNSYSSLLMFAAVMAAGLAAGAVPARSAAGLWILTLVLGAMMAWAAPSKAALTCLGLGVVVAATMAVTGLSRRGSGSRTGLTVAMVGIVFAGVVGLAGYGLTRGELPGASLNFRWRYWVGSAGIVHDAPLLGVGYDNFAAAYLKHRLPNAAEEVRDPHNVFVRAITELGPVGLLLLVGLICVSGLELGRAARASDVGENLLAEEVTSSDDRSVKELAWIAVAGLALALIIGVDFAGDEAFALLETIKRVLMAGSLVIGSAVAWTFTTRVRTDWMPLAAAWALTLLVLHNLVDFSLFEPCIGLLAAVVVGGLTNRPAEEHRHRIAFAAPLATLIMVAALSGLCIWITAAEWAARESDALLREVKHVPGNTEFTREDARQLSRAGVRMSEALALMPFNADYAARAARAFLLAHQSLGDIRELLDKAITIDPSSSIFLLNRGRLEIVAGPEGDRESGLTFMARGVGLNPNGLELQVEYASALENAGHSEAAREQIRRVLAIDAAMDPTEPRRLEAHLRATLESRLTSTSPSR